MDSQKNACGLNTPKKLLRAHRVLRAAHFVVLSALVASCSQNFDLVPIPIKPRKITISAEDSSYKPTIKTILIVDNSRSMQDEQALLATGMNKMVASFKDNQDVNLEFYIYTTSSADGVPAAQNPVHMAKKELAVVGADATLSELSDAEVIPPPATLKADLMAAVKQYLKPPVTPVIKLMRGMDADEMAAVSDSIASAVANVGVDGSDDEFGLCSIARVLTEDDPSKAVFSAEGDKVAFIVISDDDDYSTVARCSRATERKLYEYQQGIRTESAATEQVATSSAEIQYYKYEGHFAGVPSSSEQHRVSYQFVSSANFRVETSFYEPTYKAKMSYVNSAATSSVRIAYYNSEIFKATLSYEKNYCLYDGQRFPCDNSDRGPFTRTVTFDKSLVANGFSLTPTDCPDSLKSWVLSNQSISPADVSVTSCKYVVETSTAQSTELKFDPSEVSAFTAPATAVSDVACVPNLETFARSRLLPAGKRYVPSSCKYSFAAAGNATTSDLVFYSPSAYEGVVEEASNLACPPALLTAVQNKIPSGKLPVADSCRYSFSRPMVTVSSAAISVEEFKALSGISVNHLSSPQSNVDCSANSALVNYASQIASGRATRSWVTNSCHYDFLRSLSAVQTLSIVPSQYSQNVNSQTCSNALKAFVDSKVPAPFALQSTMCRYDYTPAGAAPVSICQFTDSAANKGRNLCQAGNDFTALVTASPSLCTGGSPLGRSFDASLCSRTGYKILPGAPIVSEDQYRVKNLAPLSVLDTLAPGRTDFQTSLSELAEKKFGENGFFVSAIINDEDLPQSNCPAGERAGYGKKYRALINRLGAKGFVHPICNADYSPALDKVQQFILRTMESSFKIPLQKGESLQGVSILRAAQVIQPVPGTDFQMKGEALDFAPGVLQPGDRLEIEIAVPQLLPKKTSAQ